MNGLRDVSLIYSVKTLEKFSPYLIYHYLSGCYIVVPSALKEKNIIYLPFYIYYRKHWPAGPVLHLERR